LNADIFEKFAKRTPVGVRARAALEFALDPSAMNDLFAANAERQYERRKRVLDRAELQEGVHVIGSTR